MAKDAMKKVKTTSSHVTKTNKGESQEDLVMQTIKSKVTINIIAYLNFHYILEYYFVT